ncbi:carbonic anhydrase [Thiohalophilus thiocyanatoxydans]|uniref:Carbonic anhydrase n=1 Tax=Thiohalophilus thiocyanatoxydans TaxID=381308 RepID=A0A4R8IT90_9GAMM|nr:carbonic anhydrase [Thiohalophilus thiocyanatoxydans]TDY04206.1 carbonic anhydrase [Thiohalophilus thiocyanatoxydans]
MFSGCDALKKLREGNERFSTNVRSIDSLLSYTQRANLATSQQEPIAIILGCSDSRAPAELVFDQGLGDLFVIRVAGNIVAPSQVGSVEFAADRFGTKLVVVLGHSNCGAITATLEELRRPTENQSPNLHSIVSRVSPAVQNLLDLSPDLSRQELVDKAVRANVRASCDHLRHGSAILEDLIANNGLLVVGAEYCLETGKVDFFDGVPAECE